MVRANSKLAEQVTLSKGTLWLIATLFVLANLLFNYGGSLIGWSRDDATLKADVKEMRKDVDELKVQIGDMNKSVIEERINRERQEGFKTGVAAATQGEEKK